MSQPSQPGRVPLWREEVQEALAAPPAPPSRWFAFFLTLLGLGAVIGLLAGVVLWLRPVPRVAVLPWQVADYQALAVPPLPQAAGDRQLLFGADGLFAGVTVGDEATQGHQLWQELDRLTAVDEPVVVYLSCHALRDEKGRVALLPADADPDNPATFVPLARVLEAMKACPAEHRLLLLDIAHDLADPRLGALDPDVAAAVPAEVEAAGDPELLVLTACGPGQTAHASAVLGRSAFAHYLHRGLTGGADGFAGSGPRDGRVTVRELAAFVTARVDRWAVLNRAARQTPTLLGSGTNFPLRAYEETEPTPAPEADKKAATKYPKELLDRWQAVEAAWTGGSYRLTPHLYRRQQALLLRAERSGPAGWADELALCDETAQTASKLATVPGPTPRSLALALAREGGADEALRQEVDALYVALAGVDPAAKEADAGRAKLVKDFLDKNKAQPPRALAGAVFAKAAGLGTLTADRLAATDALVQAALPDKKSLFAETLVLRELAGRPVWDGDLARQLLAATAKGERVGGQPRAVPWTRPLLETAAQLRHEGEIRYRAAGYADPAEALRLLRAAEAAYDTALAAGGEVESAVAVRDAACVVLPAYRPYLERFPEREAPWLEAVAAATKLADALTRRPATGDEVNPAIQAVRGHADTLRRLLAELQQPFAAEEVQRLVAKAKSPRASPEVVREVHAVLATPLVPPAGRAALWEAGRDLELRLNSRTAEDDAADDALREDSTALPPEDAEKSTTAARLTGQRRARWSVALLRLAGLTGEPLTTLDDALAQATRRGAPEADWFGLAVRLRQAWSPGLARRYDATTSLLDRDRLVRLYPPLDPPPGPANRPASDAALALAADEAELWTWLADRYRYQARDYLGSNLDPELVRAVAGFYSQAASLYAPFGRPLPDAPVELRAVTAAPPLTAAKPSTVIDLEVRASSPGAEKTAAPVRLDVVPPPAGVLRVLPGAVTLDKLATDPAEPGVRQGEVPLRVELESAGTLPRPLPAGFLVEARTGGRGYHHAVPVPLQPDEQLRLVWSPNPEKPDPPLEQIRLRPVNAPRAYHAHLFNPSDKEVAVLAQLFVKDAALKGVEAAVTLKPGETKPVVFPAVAPGKDGPPLLTGPLAVRLVDAKDKAVVQTFPVPVAIASPREYVTVPEIRFDPPTVANKGQNKLSVTLQTLSGVGGPDIPVGLTLDPFRIPGLLSVQGGSLLGQLKADPAAAPDRQTLYATGVRTDPAVEPLGAVTVDADGYARCFTFRTLFASEGDPLTPRAEGRPAVRFRSKPYVPSAPGFVLVIEADNAPAGATLDVSLGRLEQGEFAADLTQGFPTARKEEVRHHTDDAGALVLQGAVRDWEVVFDASQVVGRRAVRARLRDRTGATVAAVTETLTFDDTPPEVTRFLTVPLKAKKGTRVALRAAAEDAQSGIAEVVFFVGSLVDNKLPPMVQTVRAVSDGPSGTVWAGDLLLPLDRLGPTDVTMLVTNRAGLSTSAKAVIDLMEVDPATVGPGKIKGVVNEGSRPQPGVDVFLYNAKNEYVAKTTTKDDGTFLFDNLEAGKYSMVALKQSSQRRGPGVAEVRPNQTAEVTIGLSLALRPTTAP